MWADESRKRIIINVIVAVLLVAVASGLVLGIKSVNARTSQEDALLKEESTNRRQELNEARKENMEAVQQAYDQDMETVRTYLPGIVCWGDSLTAGSSGNVSYPSILQGYIDTYMCNIYDFASTLDDFAGLPRTDWTKYTVSIPVVNMGSGSEDTATILGRSGVAPYTIGKDFEIPAGTEGVTITLKAADGKADVAPLTAGNAGLNPVTIGGVEGTITLEAKGQGWGQKAYTFTRSEPGQAVTIAKGTEVISAAADEYQDCIHIVWLGTYNRLTNPEQLVTDTKALLARQTGNTDRYLVLGPCTYQGSWAVSSKTLDAIDTAMMQAFGNHYVNIRKYLMSDGLTDANYTVSTNTEKQTLSQGKVPEFFRSNGEGAELNATAYRLIGKLVYGRMESLGYFDEVRQELGLNKTTQELLKKNANYFEAAEKSLSGK